MRSITSGVIDLNDSLGIVGVHLVEVHEAGVAAGRVLVRRDHGVAGYRGLGDVADVHEVGPVAQLLGALGSSLGEISTSDRPIVGRPVSDALARAAGSAGSDDR